jgi:hypothetical protein
MSEQTVTFRRGEPITLRLEVVSGSPSGITLAAVLKRKRGSALPAEDEPDAGTFTTSFVAASGGDPAYWLLTMASAALAAGRYATDARLVQASATVQITSPITVVLLESISA